MNRGGSVGARVQVPDELREVLLEFTISYLLEQPGDVVSYAAEYFNRLREARASAQLYEGAGPSDTLSPDESTLSKEEGRIYWFFSQVVHGYLPTRCRGSGCTIFQLMEKSGYAAGFRLNKLA